MERKFVYSNLGSWRRLRQWKRSDPVELANFRRARGGRRVGPGCGCCASSRGEGSHLVLLALPACPGKQVSDDIGDVADFCEGDVTDPVAVEACVAQVCDKYGRLDICVNAAGVLDSARLVDRDGHPFPLEMYRRVLAVNLVGLFDVMRHAAAAMAVNEPGEDGSAASR